MMQDERHYPGEQLAEYLEMPADGRFAHIRRHLLECRQCRQRTETLASLRSRLAELSVERDDGVELDEREWALLERAVRGELAAGERDALVAALQSDPRRLYSALHSVSHARAMRRRADLRPIGERATSPWWKRWRSALELPVPLWIPAAVTAGLLVAVVALLPARTGTEVQIAVYQDAAVVRHLASAPLPGIGFFSAAAEREEPFGGVQLEVQTHSLRVSWPPIEGASGYVFELGLVGTDSVQQLAKIETEQAAVVLTRQQLLPGRRYTWSLSGPRAGGGLFATQGGFVVSAGVDN